MRMLPVILAAALAAPPAFAQIGSSESGRTAYARFKQLDRDGDRALTRAELQARGSRRAAETLFLILDGDGDGRLSLKEVEGAGGGGRVARFDAYDVDKDGFVVRREFPNFLDARLFTALDRDGDRRLALAEMRPAFAGARAVRPEPPVERGRREARPAPTWCWVPAFGDDGWGLEAPVVWGRCRTTASRW